ncbi:MAG: hypothetical protein KAI57_02985 [Candidatus Pacebacteria bacterium]|nr:hypothetical protein [Candidatus Paceibacterota bacterium]
MINLKEVVCFKSKEGHGRTDLNRALKHILDTKNGGSVHLCQNPNIILTKRDNEWKIRIKDTDYNISYVEINKEKFEIEKGIKKFIFFLSLTLIFEVDESTILEITKKGEQISIKSDLMGS